MKIARHINKKTLFVFLACPKFCQTFRTLLYPNTKKKPKPYEMILFTCFAFPFMLLC